MPCMSLDAAINGLVDVPDVAPPVDDEPPVLGELLSPVFELCPLPPTAGCDDGDAASATNHNIALINTK